MGEIADDLFDSMMDIDDAVFSQPRHRKRKPSGPGPCPTCGGKTVIKKGPYGTFYGCVDFPRCKEHAAETVRRPLKAQAPARSARPRRSKEKARTVSSMVAQNGQNAQVNDQAKLPKK